jgi:hypothetical protein
MAGTKELIKGMLINIKKKNPEVPYTPNDFIKSLKQSIK